MKRIVKWMASITGVEADIRKSERERLKSELIAIADKYSGNKKYRLLTSAINLVATGIEPDPETGKMFLDKTMDRFCNNEEYFKNL